MTARYPETMIFGLTRCAGSASEEEVLVRSASAGDRAAFEEIYRRYSRLVHAIVLARVPVSDAEDLVQDVFVAVFRKLHLLRTPAGFRGWLCAIARNRATEFHRAARRERQEQTCSREDTRGGPEETLIVLDAIRSLPAAYRETLILRLVEGMTGPEIADRTGLTPDSVRVNLCRGMKLLRDELGGDRNI